MDEKTLRASLRDLPLGELRYYPSLSSTNDEALAWAAQGALDMSLVVADEQTSGRGRQGRKWFTPPDSALAFSLLMRPTPEEEPFLSRIVGLAALAVAEAIRSYPVPAKIKWPNDILLSGRKAAGILVESVWNGETVDCAVIGTGLNVAQASVPPAEMVSFPATSLEDILGEASVPPREMILRDILQAFIAMRPQLKEDGLITRWEAALAFRGQAVEVVASEGEVLRGTLAGLDAEGRLLLDDDHGKRVTIHFGDVRLRPAAA